MKKKERAVISNGKASIDKLCKEELRTLCVELLSKMLEKQMQNETKTKK